MSDKSSLANPHHSSYQYVPDSVPTSPQYPPDDYTFYNIDALGFDDTTNTFFMTEDVQQQFGFNTSDPNYANSDGFNSYALQVVGKVAELDGWNDDITEDDFVYVKEPSPPPKQIKLQKIPTPPKHLSEAPVSLYEEPSPPPKQIKVAELDGINDVIDITEDDFVYVKEPSPPPKQIKLQKIPTPPKHLSEAPVSLYEIHASPPKKKQRSRNKTQPMAKKMSPFKPKQAIENKENDMKQQESQYRELQQHVTQVIVDYLKFAAIDGSGVKSYRSETEIKSHVTKYFDMLLTKRSLQSMYLVESKLMVSSTINFLVMFGYVSKATIDRKTHFRANPSLHEARISYSD